jgi:hypothetical protein
VTQPDQPAEPRRTPPSSTQELLVAILLVVTAVATSWSSYQATRWNGQQALAASKASALRIESTKLSSRADSETQVDVATFIAWADADRRGEEDLAQFYLDRFRPEFATAFAAWQATDPLVNADAPATPFAMEEYIVEAGVQSAEAEAAAGDKADEVSRNIQRASNYVLTVVLYAIVLFFAGMSLRIRNNRIRWLMITAGYILLVATLVWVATSPVSVQV